MADYLCDGKRDVNGSGWWSSQFKALTEAKPRVLVTGTTLEETKMLVPA